MHGLSIFALGATLIRVHAGQEFINPPDSTVSSESSTTLQWSQGQVMPAEWEASWDYISLVLWNDAQSSDGSEWILRVLTNQPNEGSYSFLLGDNIALNNGKSFHLEVIEVDHASGNETSNLIDSESFEILPGSSSAAATATVTQVVTKINKGSTSLMTTTAVATAAGTAASATATGNEKSTGSSNDGASGNGTDTSSGMAQSTKIGLGVGLGLGLPLLIAAAVLGWFLLARRNRSERPNYLYSGLGTELRQDPLPGDPRANYGSAEGYYGSPAEKAAGQTYDNGPAEKEGDQQRLAEMDVGDTRIHPSEPQELPS